MRKLSSSICKMRKHTIDNCLYARENDLLYDCIKRAAVFVAKHISTDDFNLIQLVAESACGKIIPAFSYYAKNPVKRNIKQYKVFLSMPDELLSSKIKLLINNKEIYVQD